MRHQQIRGWCLVAVVACTLVSPAFGYPGGPVVARMLPAPESDPASDWTPLAPQQQVPEARKFAEKPNATKKVVPTMEDRNDIDDIQTNQISNDTGFSWSNMLAMVMQMLFNPINNQQVGPNKSDSIDTETNPGSPWANLLAVGFKILSAFIGGGGAPQGDGIDKVDNSSPMQGILAAVLSAVVGSKDPDQVATMAKQAGEFINIVVNLLDALKTSFSHRSIAARSIGKKDSVSEAAVASITLLKGYVRSMKTTDENCQLKYICDANSECSSDMKGSTTIYCQLGTYAASFLLQRSNESPFDSFYEAGRRGRSGDDCRRIYATCNEV